MQLDTYTSNRKKKYLVIFCEKKEVKKTTNKMLAHGCFVNFDACVSLDINSSNKNNEQL